MAKRPTVPKFGTWDSDNVGYTVYFDKVRENKGSATAPPLQRPFNPNDPEEGPMMAVPAPSSRPATAGGRREPQPRRPSGQSHRRVGSSSSEPGGRGAEQSKFAPPPQYHPRPSPQSPQAQHRHHGGGHHHHPAPAGHGSGGGHHHHPAPAGHGGGGGHRAPLAQRQHHQHHASPQNHGPNRQRPSAVPKFGVWDEQSAASAAQGFTVQFENVKRHREVAKTGVPQVPRPPPPPEPRRSHRDNPFFSKMFGCFIPAAKD